MHNVLIGSISSVSASLASHSGMNVSGHSLTYKALLSAVSASPVLVYKCFAALACLVGSDNARKIRSEERRVGKECRL